MSRFLRNAAAAALAVAAVGAFASAASAQTYSRLVVFGDSLSDNGNLYAATGGRRSGRWRRRPRPGRQRRPGRQSRRHGKDET